MTSLGGSLSLTADGMAVGSPTYMSPEQAQGVKQIDRRTDVYSLGVIFFEILTGRSPFQADSPVRLMEMAVKAPPPRPSSLMRGASSLPAGFATLEAACLRALAKAPRDRQPTARAFAMELRPWLATVKGKGAIRNAASPRRTR
jgi:serine/threonine-protein kinase